MANEAKYSTGDAAARIGEALGTPAPSRQTVRRLIARGELIAEWTRPDSGRRDVNGKLMRGHRRIAGESLDAWIEAERKRLAAAAASAQDRDQEAWADAQGGD